MNVYDNPVGMEELLDEFIVETSELLEGVNEDLGRVTTEIQVPVMRDLSQERGLNENIDGLIRQCFPKGRDSATITDSEIQLVIDKLNNRPMKCPIFKTPNQGFFGIKPDIPLLSDLPKYYHSGVK